MRLRNNAKMTSLKLLGHYRRFHYAPHLRLRLQTARDRSWKISSGAYVPLKPGSQYDADIDVDAGHRR